MYIHTETKQNKVASQTMLGSRGMKARNPWQTSQNFLDNGKIFNFVLGDGCTHL